ncbi:DUF4992 family lipoprotein [Bacteroides sp. 51]|uniref:DUF4992 family lipoprotein n=1 Tax=Bacteroides sp. 51 TaxID=2302938 RepID=UPI0013CFA31F|nr:DUF4992 family lipoprotein [Bacteroides sp. 51]NDV83296.1 DUF4957 domain-containing protein [Bacteroides sp. 51]
MKKNYLFLWGNTQIGKGILSFCLCLFLIGVTSCKEGFDDNEHFSGGVTGVTLESPDPSAVTFTKLAGTTNVKIEWPVVIGAGGYTVSFYIVDDPDNPVLVGEENEFVDGCSAIREYQDDTRYMALIKALGNVELNNKDAVAASELSWTTLLPATLIPDGTDLTTYFANFEDTGEEVAYELVANGNYTISGDVDFDLGVVTLRGDKINRPTVVLGKDGGIITQAGLQLKWINFDCTAATKIGFLSLSENPSSTISTASLGYKADGANQDGFVINDPVTIQECNFKNLNNSLLYGNKKNWSIRYFTIMDCIVQMNNSSSNSTIHLQGASNGLIKNLTITNNTFYNLVTNDAAYFIRYSNASNAQPQKIFGNSDKSAIFTIEYNTFSRVMSNKDFGNNLPNANTISTNISYNILYDVYRLYQAVQTNTVRTTIGNTIFSVSASPTGNDTSRTDSNGNPLATYEDPEFVGPFDVEFDLTKENGGVNFTPRGSVAVGNKAGDPRWYE